MRPEEKLKHLEMIQSVVTRLAGNSFAIKGWSITLVSALFALAAKDANLRYAILALLPGLSFWSLDAYYLHQERLFRALYEAVRTGQVGDAQVQIDLYSMNTGPVRALVASWPRTIISKSIFWLHFPIVTVVMAVMIYAWRRTG